MGPAALQREETELDLGLALWVRGAVTNQLAG